jgi:K+-transporting ATPase ATPase C chain
MKAFINEFKMALIATGGLALLLAGAYPLAVWGLGQLLFPEKANGSLLKGHDGVVASYLLAQRFSTAKYFHPRPSAVGYAEFQPTSGGSNLGPLSLSLFEQVKSRIKTYREENGLPVSAPLPADAVTTSASGLDPQISLANALSQAKRIARARNLDQETILQLIREYGEERQMGIFGEKRINVLVLNLALDKRE